MIVLASTSPRRRELLRKLGRPFIVAPSSAPEKQKPGETPARLVRRLAILKAETVAKRFRKNPTPHQIIAADTVVVLNGRIFGKPRNIGHAVKMLMKLSGRTHRVYTGVAVTDAQKNRTRSAVDVSKVKVKKLTRSLALITARKHLDKSGSYACQDKKDNIVEKLTGDWQTVVGLSLRTVKHLLK